MFARLLDGRYLRATERLASIAAMLHKLLQLGLSHTIIQYSKERKESYEVTKVKEALIFARFKPINGEPPCSLILLRLRGHYAGHSKSMFIEWTAVPYPPSH